MTRVALFDWVAGGHHAIYLDRVAEALEGMTEVTVAAPDETLTTLERRAVSTFSLGPARPREDFSKPMRTQLRELAQRELELIDTVDREVRPDHLVVMYADNVLRSLVRHRPLDAKLSTVVFYPRAHYPRVYKSSLSPIDRLRGEFLEMSVRRLRRRRDANAVFALDPHIVSLWQRRGGCPAYWFPEPPVHRAPMPDRVREGVVVYGVLSRHKGLDRLVSALGRHADGLKLTLAGPVQPEFEDDLCTIVAALEHGGIELDLRLRPHEEGEGLELLARARVAVLPYPNHIGMSRVLLEAASVGTPVVADSFGLIGALVRDHRLGLTVDTSDADALRAAILTLATDPDASTRYGKSQAAFATQHAVEAFRRAIAQAFSADSP